MAEYKEVFMLFDKDEDGVLSFPELAVVMKSLGQRPSGKAAFLHAYDFAFRTPKILFPALALPLQRASRYQYSTP